MTDAHLDNLIRFPAAPRPIEQDFAVVIAALLAGRCDGGQAVAELTAIARSALSRENFGHCTQHAAHDVDCSRCRIAEQDLAGALGEETCDD